jgi:hypothetical protein
MFTTSNPAAKLLAVFATILTAGSCLAQDSTAVPAQTPSTVQANPQNEQQPPASAPKTITVPAGTRISLVVARPMRIKHAREGDSVYLQTAFPVIAGNKMVIPPGTYVQGVIQKVNHRDTTYRVIEFEMGSANVIFSNGYTVPIYGTQYVQPTVAQLSLPGKKGGKSVPVMAATGAPAPPPLPPLPGFGNGPRNAMIGLGVAAAAGLVFVGVMASRSPGPLMHAGTPMEMVLAGPLVLDADQVAAAIALYNGQIPVQPPVPY